MRLETAKPILYRRRDHSPEQMVDFAAMLRQPGQVWLALPGRDFDDTRVFKRQVYAAAGNRRGCVPSFRSIFGVGLFFRFLPTDPELRKKVLQEMDAVPSGLSEQEVRR